MGRVALRGSYVEVVFFMGINERYPAWFADELYNNIFQDADRYTFWVPEYQRTPDYHEKQLVDDYSVFIRKTTGEIHVIDYDLFIEVFYLFRYDKFTNSGLAAMNEDCIDYVECHGGELSSGYPEWFEEYFTEAVNFPGDDSTLFFYDNNDPFDDVVTLVVNDNSVVVAINGDVEVTSRCVFLRNKFGEVRGLGYHTFLKYYDPDPPL